MQRIAVPPRTGLRAIDRVGLWWRVWIAADPTFTYGTYLILHHDGMVERVTEREDGTYEDFLIKEKDNGNETGI